jgi:twitching motility protein PilT
MDGRGRALCMEIMVPDMAIRNLIREDKVHQIYSQIQVGQAKSGMQTFNQSLLILYHRRVISFDDAMSRSPIPDELKQMMENMGKVVKKA